MQDFFEKIDNLDLDNKEETQKLKTSCDSLQNCFSALDCKTSADKETADISGMIKTYCDIIIYFSTEFNECGDKLEQKSSPCFENWDPFTEKVSKDADKPKKEELRKENCQSFFGKNNCLKQEIMETCSEREWNDFRSHFITLNNITNQCEFGIEESQTFI